MNFVYINTHDTGRQLSPYGYKAPTEAFQKLAEESALFTQAFCCGPTCSPSRAAMLTGCYPHQNGMLGLAQRGFSLSDPSHHLAAYLRSKGYATAISGIQHEVGWYLDIDEAALSRIGYDTVLTADAHRYRKEDLCEWDTENAKNAVEWIRQYKSEKPFMLSYGMHSTHRPYPDTISNNIDERYVKPPYPIHDTEKNRHDHAAFLTSLERADKNLSMIIQALKESGQMDHTIIMYTTDHGVAVPYNKCFLSDAGVGVGLMLRVPNTDSQGIVIDSLISQIDIFPTICDLLSVEKPSYLEGKSFARGLMNADVKGDEEIYAEQNFHTSYEPARCVRTERYKYIRYYDLTWKKTNLSNMDESLPKEELMQSGLQDRAKDMEALYDLLYDPGEKNNLIFSKEYEQILNDMRMKLDSHLERTNDPILNGDIEIKDTYKVNKKSCEKASSRNPDDYDSYPEAD